MRTPCGRKMFEAKWLLENSFDDAVESAWENAKAESSPQA